MKRNDGKGEQRMMKKYKAIKPTIKAVKITDDVSFYENQCKRKDGGTDFYESEEFLKFYEKA